MVSYVAKSLHFTHAIFTPTSFSVKKKEISLFDLYYKLLYI